MSARIYGWDEKLAEGKDGEEVVLRWLAARVFPERVDDVRERVGFQMLDVDFLVGATAYEVKTDLLAHQTGNLFLELDALEKSQADLWLLYLPQRDWLFQFARADLLAYALALAPTRARSVTTERHGRRWSVRGVPVRISEALLNLHGTLFTQISKTGDGGGLRHDRA